MATPTSGAVPVARNEPRTRTALVLEAIALRHQIAVLERSRTRRPCFRRIDRLFWILLSGWQYHRFLGRSQKLGAVNTRDDDGEPIYRSVSANWHPSIPDPPRNW